MEKFNWKEVKNIVDAFTGKKPPGKPKIKPIFAYSTVDPVPLSLKAYLFIDFLDSADKFSYVVTLIEKQNRYHAATRAYLLTKVGEQPILYEQEEFSKNEKPSLDRFMKQPFSVFQRGKHLRAMTFKDSDMTEDDFDTLIELWRNNQQIQN